MRPASAWVALLVSCLGNDLVGGPLHFVLAGKGKAISCDPSVDPDDPNVILCQRQFKQYPGCQHYSIDSWEDAHFDTYGPEGMCGSLANTLYANTSTYWRTFCEPTRQCKCYTATMEDDYTDYEIVVDCSNMGLNDIPLGLPPDVHSLLLQGNNFTRLSLRSIVRALGTDLVNGTHDYPTTEATGPLMRLVGGEESGGFPSLRRLYLHNNPSLTVIDDDAFLATQRIRELLLHHTGLSELRRKSLLGLQNSLHTLWAQNSMITYIQPTTFLNFSKLTRMWLYNNPNTAEVNPKDLQGSMFRGLDSIRELVIDRVHKYKHGKISTKNFTCCNLVGLEEKMEARVYVGIDTKEKTISEGVVYKKPLFCGDCNSDSAAENGECWDDFDGCHQFNQDFDDFGYAYIYPYKEGHKYELPHNSAVGKAAALWSAVLVFLACFACSTGTWDL